MREPILWLAIGTAATAMTAIVLFRKKTPASTSAPPTAPTYGETTKVSLQVPDGWRRATNAEVAALPELESVANALRSSAGFTSMQYGTLTPFVASDGKTYATWVEQHYHPPGGTLRPWGLHHGVTILAKVEPASMLLDEWQTARLR